MSIKLNPSAENATSGLFAIAAPHPSDVISGALRQAFEAPIDDRELSILLTRIDQADRTHGRA